MTSMSDFSGRSQGLCGEEINALLCLQADVCAIGCVRRQKGQYCSARLSSVCDFLMLLYSSCGGNSTTALIASYVSLCVNKQK